MMHFPENAAEQQQVAFDAAVNLSETFLTSIEKLTQLNFDAARAAFEDSSAIAHRYLTARSPEVAVSGLNEFLQPQLERFGAYVRGIHDIAQEAASRSLSR